MIVSYYLFNRIMSWDMKGFCILDNKICNIKCKLSYHKFPQFLIFLFYLNGIGFLKWLSLFLEILIYAQNFI